MRKKFVILGLVLLLAGSVMLGGVLVEERKQQQRAANLKKRNRLELRPGKTVSD